MSQSDWRYIDAVLLVAAMAILFVSWVGVCVAQAYIGGGL